MKTLLSVLSLAIFTMVSCQESTTLATKDTGSSGTMMKAVIENIPENWKDKNGTVLKNASSDFIRTSNGKVEASSLKEYEDAMAVFKSSFPDCKITVSSIETKANKAYVNWIFSGSNTNEFLGKPATNKSVSVNGFSIWSFNDKGQPIREDAFFDWMDLMTQLGYSFSYPSKS